MTIRVSQKNWNDKLFRKVILNVADMFKEDIEIKQPKQKFKPYNVQIWCKDDIMFSKDFSNRCQAKKYIKKILSMKKYKNAYADLKKYNKKHDDFDWWFFRFKDNKLIEVVTPEEE